jgi:hypothetical protein
MRVGCNVTRNLSDLLLISMAPIANLRRNLFFRRVLFVATLTGDTSDFVFIR